MSTSSDFYITLEAASALLPEQTAEQLRFVTMLQRGSLEIELYAPQGEDLQTPHTRDEVYVVIAGSGEFINGEERHRFGPGDLLVVPAGVEHRFVDFTMDFRAWVIFYGPQGGEQIPSEGINPPSI
jgi:mannose-6-phosphate isomerase-like protein (cupin superfamily)